MCAYIPKYVPLLFEIKKGRGWSEQRMLLETKVKIIHMKKERDKNHFICDVGTDTKDSQRSRKVYSMSSLNSCKNE